MRNSTVLTALLAVLGLSCMSASNADDRNYPNVGGASRGMYGMPASLRGNSFRPMTTGYGYNSANCPNGRCGTSYCPNGDCSTSACANGECATGNCANGQCATGDCPNGRCGTSYGGRTGSASCPNGKCGVSGMTGRAPRPSLYSAQTDWSPRSSRGLADPYRRTGFSNESSEWTQRTLRPVFEPVNDTFRSRYNEEELDLNSDYFRGRNELDRYNDRSNSDRSMYQPVRPSSRNWNGPSDRSLEAPAPATRSTRI